MRKTGEKKRFGGGREQGREKVWPESTPTEPESHDSKGRKEDGLQRREEEVAKEKTGEVGKSKT